MTDENYEARAQAHLASLKRDMRKTLEDATVRAVHKVMAEFEAKSDERLMEDWGHGPHERHSQQAREPEHPAKPLTTEQMQGWVKETWEKCLTEAHQEPEFITHSVDQPYDWSEWVCPDPKSYLMKCCDCGLVHEAQFGVVRYASEAERENCETVDDPNLQAVFRMRRSEQWSPVDTAHRAGGLPMERPAQEPVMIYHGGCTIDCGEHGHHNMEMLKLIPAGTKLYDRPQAREPLSDEQIEKKFMECGGKWNGDQWVIEDADFHPFVRTIESSELNTLRAISDEYNAWIKHHAAGHSYDDFLSKRAAHGIKGDA